MADRLTFSLRLPLLVILSVALFSQSIQHAGALENGLARTPPMGWVAWERFLCQVDCYKYPDDCVSARLFKQMAQRLAEDKWLDLGYKYVNIDDCWSEREREAKTQLLVADTKRFPGGIENLARFVHNFDGLKLGIYGDCGTRTCGGYPGQLKSDATTPTQQDVPGTATYFSLDASTFAQWQVDSLKFDGCHVDPLKAERICPMMSVALNITKRPILLVCEWPFYMMYAHAEADWELASSSCNVWRYYDDIEGKCFASLSLLAAPPSGPILLLLATRDHLRVPNWRICRRGQSRAKSLMRPGGWLVILLIVGPAPTRGHLRRMRVGAVSPGPSLLAGLFFLLACAIRARATCCSAFNCNQTSDSGARQRLCHEPKRNHHPKPAPTAPRRNLGHF